MLLYWGVFPQKEATFTMRSVFPLNLFSLTDLPSMSFTVKSRTEEGFFSSGLRLTVKPPVAGPSMLVVLAQVGWLINEMTAAARIAEAITPRKRNRMRLMMSP